MASSVLCIFYSVSPVDGSLIKVEKNDGLKQLYIRMIKLYPTDTIPFYKTKEKGLLMALTGKEKQSITASQPSMKNELKL